MLRQDITPIQQDEKSNAGKKVEDRDTYEKITLSVPQSFTADAR